MNILNYKTGELIIDRKKIQLTKMESKIIFVLINNRLITYEEIYNYMYSTDVKGTLERQMTQCINTHICRLRKKGLKIMTKYNFGVRLIDKICLQ